MTDYIARIENGESPVEVFSPVSKFKESLTDFVDKFVDISGIYVQPDVCVAVYSHDGGVLKINANGNPTGNLFIGTPRDQALLSDLSHVKYMLDAFGKALSVPKQAFSVGIVRDGWLAASKS